MKSEKRQFIEKLMGDNFMIQPHAEQYVDDAEKELLEAIEKDNPEQFSREGMLTFAVSEKSYFDFLVANKRSQIDIEHCMAAFKAGYVEAAAKEKELTDCLSKLVDAYNSEKSISQFLLDEATGFLI